MLHQSWGRGVRDKMVKSKTIVESVRKLFEAEYFFSPLLRITSDSYRKMMEACFNEVKPDYRDNERLRKLSSSVTPISKLEGLQLERLEGYRKL